MPTHFADTYAAIDEIPDRRVLCYVRSDVSFPSTEALERSFDAICRHLDRLGRERFTLLVDLREVRGSNDPAFEVAITRARRRMMAGFPRVALLVRSAAGLLQVQRQAREDGSAARAFQDEAEALAYLAPEPR